MKPMEAPPSPACIVLEQRGTLPPEAGQSIFGQNHLLACSSSALWRNFSPGICRLLGLSTNELQCGEAGEEFATVITLSGITEPLFWNDPMMSSLSSTHEPSRFAGRSLFD